MELVPNGARGAGAVAAGFGAGTMRGAGAVIAGAARSRPVSGGATRATDRRVATTRRSTICAGGFTAGPPLATKLDASGVTRRRPRTGSRRRTSTSLTRASCAPRRPNASSRTLTTAL